MAGDKFAIQEVDKDLIQIVKQSTQPQLKTPPDIRQILNQKVQAKRAVK